MLEIAGRRKQGGKSSGRLAGLPPVQPALDSGQLVHVPVWALVSRDAQVTDLAVKVDRLQRQLDVAAGELAAFKRDALRLAEDADHVRRFSDLMERESRMRLEKAESTLRMAREVKARLDRIEAKDGGNYHGYATFEAVSIRLTELGELEKTIPMLLQALKRAAAIAAGAILALGLTALYFWM